MQSKSGGVMSVIYDAHNNLYRAAIGATVCYARDRQAAMQRVLDWFVKHRLLTFTQ